MDALQDTIDSCINSAMHRSTQLEHRFTKFSEITRCNGHYAVQGGPFKVIDFGTNRKLIGLYEFLLVINTCYLTPFPSYVWLLVKFSLARAECLTLTFSVEVIPRQCRHKLYIAKTRFFGLHLCCRKYWCIFNHFYVIRLENNRIRWNYAAVRAITQFKVT